MPIPPNFPARQVHLDFHTSEHIPDVGAKFDRQQFQEALKTGHVNSITLFAKCHHSWFYYPSTAGKPHPHLVVSLLDEQIAACREIGVRCPLYFAVGWSATDALEHPEWHLKNRDGSTSTFRFVLDAAPEDRIPDNAWINLCPSGIYREVMLAQVREICERWEQLDGMFFDICNTRLCWCENCRAGMQAMGGDASQEADVYAYSVQKWQRFLGEIRALIAERHPEATCFFNGITHPFTPGELLDLETHFELEDLPTAWGGYDKLPPRARFFAAFDPTKPRLGMTGKFHTQWGEFGGFKHPDALRYECAAMIALGCGCSVGDQMHPLGFADPETYRRIGEAYSYVAQIEEFGLPSVPYTPLAVWPSRAGRGVIGGADAPWAGTVTLAHDEGTYQALLERQLDFDIIHPDGDADLNRYKAIVLTGGRCLDRAQAERLQRYVEAGGSLILQYESLLERTTGEPLTDLLNVGGAWQGSGTFEVDYVQAGEALRTGKENELPVSPVLCYTSAARVLPTGGEVLAQIYEPYFDRRYAHYCSHRNTPYRPEPADQAAVLQRGNIVYFAHPLGALYHAHGARIHRELLLAGLQQVGFTPALNVTLPSAGRATLLHQPEKRRYVVHLLYAPPLPRGHCLVIEDMPPLHDLPVTVRVPETIQSVSFPLEKTNAEWKNDENGLHFVVPEVRLHKIITLEY